MRRAVLLLCLFSAGAARADTILAALHAERWTDAQSMAATEPDPVARKLVLYYRLLTPGAAGAAEIAGFLADSPDWPLQSLLSRRLAEALLLDHDDRTVLDICQHRPPSAVPSLLRCADAAARTGQPPEAAAGRAWLLGITDPAGEAAFMRQWGRILTPDDQRRRFERLAWAESAAPGGVLARQALRLAPASHPAAEARLALRRDDPVAPALFAALPEPARTEPGLVLDLARWYRRAGLDRDAASVWTERGQAAERAAPPDRQAAFWDERNLLVRRLLRTHEDALAAAVVAEPAAAPEAAGDADFLAGWIALRRLNQPQAALRRFLALAARSHAAITQGRAHYWAARALAAAGDPDAARTEFATAASWSTTFYGQLAALALGDGDQGLARRIQAATDPPWTEDRALDLSGGELARAAAMLAIWGEPGRAKPFLSRMDELVSDPAGRALTARLAAGLGLPDQAVAAARRAGRDGVALPVAGWPAPFQPPPGAVEPAVALGLIRQESSFDPQAQSPAGARGLMQLMPATAAAMSRQLDAAAPSPAALTDPAVNMRLGTAYLASLLNQFAGALPFALAAYNAGPSRVQDWIAAAPPGDIIDWIELIPFNETRNYVQRVIENVVIYRAQSSGPQSSRTVPHPLARWQG